MNLNRYEPIVLNILRIMAGFLFFQHGAAKLWGWFDATPVELPELRFFAGVIEFFGGLLIMVGLGTRATAFLSSGLMAFAYLLSHAPRGFWPYENGGSLAALYCFVFLYLVFRGPGAFSADAVIARRTGRTLGGEAVPAPRRG
jgi:putative oxidoreductase